MLQTWTVMSVSNLVSSPGITSFSTSDLESVQRRLQADDTQLSKPFRLS
jgi:hypothetical protein